MLHSSDFQEQLVRQCHFIKHLECITNPIFHVDGKDTQLGARTQFPSELHELCMASFLASDVYFTLNSSYLFKT
jgi:hypothetical protein